MISAGNWDELTRPCSSNTGLLVYITRPISRAKLRWAGPLEQLRVRLWLLLPDGVAVGAVNRLRPVALLSDSVQQHRLRRCERHSGRNPVVEQDG